ncbi:helix-turn-helix domain-containing protein [Desulfosporosinus shakirovi]|uniref:helix-turn-helix domain-containing protein n=1 Tax=Desulfosporosinus shakirovi TaxID=2885154 RepID=UPI001E544AC9|nr:helix-turn-helix domain-containing protein [Desulfosporosinus sp. SRJS8]MCB8817590.1 helix-turn-helix domain-containing protein [Desulfosporosinus sp. SRJS8]
MQTTQGIRRYHSRRPLTVDLTINSIVVNGKKTKYSQRAGQVLRTRYLKKLAYSNNLEQLRKNLEALIEIDCKEAQLPTLTFQSIQETLRFVGFENKEMWNTGKVAKKLGISNQTVVNWIRAGRLKGLKLPSGQYRVYADQFRTTDAQDAEFDAFFDEMTERHKDVLPLSDDCLEDL